LGWKHGIQNLWMMPNIYAVGPDGKVAGGCRALEAIRIVWDLANEPDNLLGARKLTEKGELFSDMIDPAKPLAPSQQRFEGASVSRIVSNPVEAAARQYFRERGANALNHAIRRLLDEVFPR
jgi:hypothetical protein